MGDSKAVGSILIILKLKIASYVAPCSLKFTEGLGDCCFLQLTWYSFVSYSERRTASVPIRSLLSWLNSPRLLTTDKYGCQCDRSLEWEQPGDCSSLIQPCVIGGNPWYTDSFEKSF